MKWKDKLLKKVIYDLQNDILWSPFIDKIKDDYSKIGIHLAIFSEPILEKLLAGEKTTESRFSANKVCPYGQIHSGDLVLVKKSGGPVVAAFISGDVKTYSNLTPEKVEILRDKYSQALGLPVDDDFWIDKAKSKYATIIKIVLLKKIPAYFIDKKDRTGWVIIKQRTGLFESK